MTRQVPEWVGPNPDAAIPPRVKVRILERHGCRCVECTRKLGGAGQPFDFDHATALVNGGEHRESNIVPMCKVCHRIKTKADVAEKSRIARKKAKHLGIERKKAVIPGSKNSPFRKKLDGTVERR